MTDKENALCLLVMTANLVILTSQYDKISRYNKIRHYKQGVKSK